jgi:hypothetical protein
MKQFKLFHILSRGTFYCFEDKSVYNQIRGRTRNRAYGYSKKIFFRIIEQLQEQDLKLVCMFKKAQKFTFAFAKIINSSYNTYS